jgi:hypothetical protein
MREKHILFAMVLGTLLGSIVPAATYAQDKLERFQEQPQIIDSHSTRAATGEVAHGKVADRADIEVELLRVPPLGRAGPELTDLVERSDRTKVVVTLTGAPADLLSPDLIAEIHEGTCVDLKSALGRGTEESSVGFSLTPSVFSLHSFGAILPVSFSGLRSSAHAITIRTGQEMGNTPLACVDIA